jgi:predicted DsbA family dithiol-disulfide isomerase
LDVFADISCPFTHVGLRRFVAGRAAAGRAEPVLHVRAWPLELVNGEPLRGGAVAPKIEALRASVAPDLFTGFDPERFPSSTRPALAAVAAAYRQGPGVGERFSLAVRDALFEDGLDIADDRVLDGLRLAAGIGVPTDEDVLSIALDHAEGQRRGVLGSPHFFVAGASWFCPSLRVGHHGDELDITFDAEGFERFMAAALA